MTNVLIIDDDVTRLHHVSRIVEAEGLSVSNAGDMPPSSIAPDHAPDIVLLAASPAGENYFVDRHIFTASGTPHDKPVIVIAGRHASPEDVAAGVRSAVHALRARDRQGEHHGGSVGGTPRPPQSLQSPQSLHTGEAAMPDTTGAAPADAPVHHDTPAALTFAPGTPLAEVERQVILATLAANGGARNKTATALGISQKTLYNKLKQFETKASADARINPVAAQ